MISFDEFQDLIQKSLGEHRIVPFVEDMLLKQVSLEKRGRRLLGRVNTMLQHLAVVAKNEDGRICRALEAAKITFDSREIPVRVPYPMLTLIGDVGRIADELVKLGYMVAGNDRQESSLELVMVATDAFTTRITIRTQDEAAPRRSSDALRSKGSVGRYIGTPTEMIDAVFDQVELTKDKVVVDLGCGDGRILLRVASRFGCRAWGIESNGMLAERARLSVQQSNVSNLVEIVEDDFEQILGRTLFGVKVDVVFMFLPIESVAKLLPRVLAELSPGAMILSHEHLSTDWPIAPTRSTLIVSGGLTVANVWVAPNLPT